MLNEVIKYKSDGTSLVIKEVSYDTARDMIIENHYSHKWNSAFGRYNYGIFKDDRLLGVAVYGNLMNPKSAYKLVDGGRIIELNRLWVDDELGKNTETMFLSATFKLLRENTDIDAIQSFADGRLGVGTIYKASNFDYYGKETSLFFENKITGDIQHKVPLENTKRPLGFLKYNLELIRGNMTVFEVDTYRYIYPLRKKIKINLEKQPYPDYQKGQREVSFIQRKGVLIRMLIMLDNLGLDTEYDEVLDYLIDNYTVSEQDFSDQKENDSIKWFISDYVNNNRDKLRESLR